MKDETMNVHGGFLLLFHVPFILEGLNDKLN